MDNFTEFWCFRLAALGRKISRQYSASFAPYGITPTQSFVLFVLLSHDGSSVKDIASRIQLDSPAVTGVIDRLVKEELVKRQEDPSDRRSLQIFLTSRGRELARQLLPIAQEFNRSLQSGLNPDQRQLFGQVLTRLE